MKFFRYRTAKGVRPGVARFDEHYDLGEFFQDIDREFIEQVDIERIKFLLDSGKLASIESPDFDSPIYRPGKIVCIGLNYQKHARESGMEVPKEPVIFFKATSSLSGAFDDVVIPKGSEKTDWEVELAVVIGKEASYVDKDD
ncbi:MAG: fumarylacetoacetate hydrolase family protein, partial [Bacteroidota bacterium]